MEYVYITLEVVILVAIATAVYLIVIAAPRVQDDEHFGDHPVKNLAKNIPLERIDNFIASAIDKMLRRFKVWILKADNVVTKHLNNRKDEPINRL